MANFMYQRRKLLGWFHSGKQSDLAAVRETFRGCNSLGVVQFHALRLHEVEQSFAIPAHVALHFGQGREFLTFGLADVLSRDLWPSLCAPDVIREWMYFLIAVKRRWLLCRFT